MNKETFVLPMEYIFIGYEYTYNFCHIICNIELS